MLKSMKFKSFKIRNTEGNTCVSGERAGKVRQQPVHQVQNPVEPHGHLRRGGGRGGGEDRPHPRVQHRAAGGGPPVFHSSLLWQSEGLWAFWR
jgi:hypothetical protein